MCIGEVNDEEEERIRGTGEGPLGSRFTNSAAVYDVTLADAERPLLGLSDAQCDFRFHLLHIWGMPSTTSSHQSTISLKAKLSKVNYEFCSIFLE